MVIQIALGRAWHLLMGISRMTRPILFVDDQEDILRILEREFIRTGDYEVHIARSPAEARRMLQRVAVELVIADVRLGEETGFQLLRDLRETHPGLGMMMMTAYRSPGYRQQADALGVAFFIEKPFAVNTLLRAVERFFLTREAPRPTMATAAGPRGNYDALSQFKVQDIVQLFCLNGRSVTMQLTFPGEATRGVVVIREGRVAHAEFGTLIGEPAFYRIVAHDQVEFQLDEVGDTLYPDSIEASWEFLLLESARMTDEGIAGAPADFDAAAAVADQHHANEPVYATPQPAKQAAPADDPFADFWKKAQLPPGDKLKLR